MGKILGGTRRNQTEFEHNYLGGSRPCLGWVVAVRRCGLQRLGLLNWETHIAVPKESFWWNKKLGNAAATGVARLLQGASTRLLV